MKYLIILFCIGIIVLGIYIVIKNIKNSVKGKGCQSCGGCNNGCCNKNQTEACNEQTNKNIRGELS